MRIIERNPQPLYNWIAGWLGLAEAIVAILSLGFLHLNFLYKYTFWQAKRMAMHATIEGEYFEEDEELPFMDWPSDDPSLDITEAQP